MATKVVLSVQARGDEKGKILRTVTSILGIDDVYTSTNREKIIVAVVGKMDAIDLADKLRDQWRSTQLINVHPVEEEKKEVRKKQPAEVRVLKYVKKK